MEDQHEPLISNTFEPRNDEYSPKLPEETPGWFAWLLTLSAGISGLLFGYDTGVISATLVSIDSSLSNRQLSSLDKSIITSSTALLALLISPFSSVLADRLGRKRVILFADVLFAVGAVIQAYSHHVTSMVIGRSVIGAAVGAASFVAPLYIAELAPSAYRGRLVTVNIVFVTLGQVIAYIVGWVFAEHGDSAAGWRWMVGLGALPAITQLVLVAYMPETPRWLVKAGQSQAARAVITKVTGAGEDGTRLVDMTLKEIERETQEEDAARRLRGRHDHNTARWTEGWHELFHVRRNRRALLISCLLQGLQQLCGFNSLMYYAASIFQLLGFTVPTLTSLIVAVTNFAFTVAALVLVDRVGRRRILLWSVPFMACGLVLAAYGFYIVRLTSTSWTRSQAPDPPHNQVGALLVLFSIAIYVAGYAIGLGNVPWMQSELFSLSVRSLGSGIATATNWGANFVVGLTFLPLMDLLSPSVTFLLYAAICVLGWVMIRKIYPETSGLSLEEAASIIEADDWGVGSRWKSCF